MPTGNQIVRVRVPVAAANLTALMVTATLFLLLAGLGSGLDRWRPATGADLARFVAAFVTLVYVHEWLHLASLRRRTQLPRSAFQLGIQWRALMPYCHCSLPVPVADYAAHALAPLLVTGPALLLVFLLWPAGWTALLAALAVSACTADVWIAAQLWRFPARALAVDHPTEPGCDVHVGAD